MNFQETPGRFPTVLTVMEPCKACEDISRGRCTPQRPLYELKQQPQNLIKRRDHKSGTSVLPSWLLLIQPADASERDDVTSNPTFDSCSTSETGAHSFLPRDKYKCVDSVYRGEKITFVFVNSSLSIQPTQSQYRNRRSGFGVVSGCCQEQSHDPLYQLPTGAGRC